MTDQYHVALCSGGTDSIAATHAAMTFGPAEEVVFLHTRTDPPDARSAIDATIDWLREWCDDHGWPFRVAHAPQQFDEITAEHGAPTSAIHGLMYRRLKDRTIDAVRKAVDNAAKWLYDWFEDSETHYRTEYVDASAEHKAAAELASAWYDEVSGQ